MTLNPITAAADAASPYAENATSGSAATTGSSSASPSAGGSEVTQDQFLQLLVTQLKNQDPLNPTDSDQFMSELAQFSQLQEVIGVHQDLNALLGYDGVTVPNS